MKKYISIKFLILFALTLFVSCEDETTIPLVDGTNNGFQSKEIAETFVQNCNDAGCHGNVEPHHDLKFNSFSEMIKGSIGRVSMT